MRFQELSSSTAIKYINFFLAILHVGNFKLGVNLSISRVQCWSAAFILYFEQYACGQCRFLWMVKSKKTDNFRSFHTNDTTHGDNLLLLILTYHKQVHLTIAERSWQ